MVQNAVTASAQAGEVLGRAFQSDPLFDYLLPKPEVRDLVLPAFFGIVAAYSEAYGVLDLAPEGHGVACWLRPGLTALSMRRMVRLGLTRWRPWLALFRLGWKGGRRLSVLTAYADDQHHHVAPGAHWYLWAFGVDPVRQRQGVGAKLLQAGLDRADADHLPCYLETNNVLNVVFYQKRGFKVVSRGQPPGHEVTFWAMRRDAQ